MVMASVYLSFLYDYLHSSLSFVVQLFNMVSYEAPVYIKSSNMTAYVGFVSDLMARKFDLCYGTLQDKKNLMQSLGRTTEVRDISRFLLARKNPG